MEKKALSIKEFCAAYGISRSSVYNLFAASKLKPVKLGSKTLIPVVEANRWWSTVSPDNAASGPAGGTR